MIQMFKCIIERIKKKKTGLLIIYAFISCNVTCSFSKVFKF